MAGQPQNLNFPFSQGLDTRSEDKHVQPPRLLKAENVVFDEIGAVKKRVGYTQLGKYDVTEAHESDVEEVVGGAQDITEFRYTAGQKLEGLDQLIAVAELENDSGQDDADGWRVVSRLGVDGTWQECGAHNPVSHRMRDLSRSENMVSAGHVYCGEYIVCAFLRATGTVIGGGTQSLFLEVFDKDTETLVASWEYAGYTNKVYLCVHPLETKVSIVAQYSGTARLDKAVWTLATPTTQPTFDTAYITDRATGNSLNWYACTYYRGTSAFYTAVVYAETGGDVKLSIATFDAPTIQFTDTITPSGTTISFSAYSPMSGGDYQTLHILYYDMTDDEIVYVAAEAATLGTPETVESFAASDLVYATCIGYDEIDASVRAFWSQTIGGDDKFQLGTCSRAGGSWGTSIVSSGLTGDGAYSSAVNQYGYHLYGSPFTYEKRIMVPVAYRDSIQSSLFVVGLRDVGGTVYFELVAGMMRDRVGKLSRAVPQVVDMGSGQFSMIATREEYETGGAGSRSLYSSVVHLVLDFAAKPAGVRAGDLHLVTGGVTRGFDGARSFTAGPLHFPDGMQLTSKAGTGSLVAGGVYNYKACYEYTDRLGNRWRSTPSGATEITVGGGHDTVDVEVPGIPLIDIEPGLDIEIRIYRTTDGGATYYDTGLVLDNVLTGSTVPTAEDTESDANLADNATLYTTGGELANDPPPSACAIASVGSRVFLVPCGDRKTVWFSKEKVDTLGVDFSSSLTLRIQDEGDITALASLDNRLVAFKRTGIYLIDGAGPNALGQGSFRPAQKVSSDVGAINQRGVVATDSGIMFKSDKGIYLLDRGLQVQYIGAGVDSDNANAIVSAVLHKDENKVIFATDNSRMLVYDSLTGQWSVWTTTLSLADMTIWAGKHVQAGGAAAWVQDSTTYLDDDAAYLVSVRTGWIQPFGVGGYGRIYHVFLLGDAFDTLSGYNINAKYYYDYSDTPVETIAISDPEIEGDRLRHRMRPGRGKLVSVSILIDETNSTPRDNRELTLAGLSLAVAPKRGSYRFNVTE